MIRRIIRHMRQILDMHRMVKIVERRTEEIELENKGKTLIDVLANLYPKIDSVKEIYKEKYDTNQTRANKAFNDALSKEYIKEIPKHFKSQTAQGKDFKLPYYAVATTKGGELTDSFLYVPWGLLRAWVKQYGATMTALIALGIGIAFRLVWSLVEEYIINK